MDIILVILKTKKLLKYFTKKEFKVEKVIKRKGEELYVKQKGYNNLFNSWKDEKDSIND